MEQSDSQHKPFVELEKVIASKSPRALSLTPGFVIRYLKKVIHQDELNQAMHRLREIHGLEFVDKILEEFGVEVRIEGLEHISGIERYIVASNHPLGGLDGMALMKAVGAVRSDIVFPVNDFLLNLPNLKDLFVPINKIGKNNAETSELLNTTFASNKMLLYFPAGLVSRKQNGIIYDLEWKKTFVNKAIQYQRDVIPVHINGNNSNFFYRASTMDDFLPDCNSFSFK